MSGVLDLMQGCRSKVLRGKKCCSKRSAGVASFNAPHIIHQGAIFSSLILVILHVFAYFCLMIHNSKLFTGYSLILSLSCWENKLQPYRSNLAALHFLQYFDSRLFWSSKNMQLYLYSMRNRTKPPFFLVQMQMEMMQIAKKYIFWLCEWKLNITKLYQFLCELSYLCQNMCFDIRRWWLLFLCTIAHRSDEKLMHDNNNTWSFLNLVLGHIWCVSFIASCDHLYFVYPKTL